MITQIYPTELQLNKANNIDSDAAFLIFYLILKGLFHQKFMTNAMILILILLISRFEVATFLVPAPMVLTRFARASSCLADFNTCNKKKAFFLPSFIVDTTNWSLNSLPD